MGFISWFRQAGAVRKIVTEAWGRWAQAAALDSEDLRKLSDDELYEILYDRLLTKTGGASVSEDLKELHPAEQAFYILMIFDMEILNGGLVQFFMNAPELAPYVSDALRDMNARSLAERYEMFLTRHQIDPRDLSSFQIDETEGFAMQASRYPFEEFEDAYDEMLQRELMLNHAKKHLEEF